MIMPSPIAEQATQLARILDKPRRVAVTTHVNPDGDAMGSSLGLARVLEAMGHTVRVVLPNPAPANLRWMPGYDQALDHWSHREESEQAVGKAQVVFALDYNQVERVKDLAPLVDAAPLRVMIDHHRNPDEGFDLIISEVGASSTCQLVYDVIVALGQRNLIDADVATCLYTGIMTDSGSFRFASTTPHTHQVAAELLRCGALPDRIHGAIMEDNRLERLRLTGFALSERLEVVEEGKAAIIALSTADLERLNYVPGDTEGLVNWGLTIRGVRVSAFLAEHQGIVKCSLRSKGALPVNEFMASHFSGGGHANAAGGRFDGELEDALKKLRAELPAFLKEHAA